MPSAPSMSALGRPIRRDAPAASNTPTRGIGQTTVEAARTLAAQEALPLFEVLSHAGQYPELARAGAKLLKFTDMILQLRELAALLQRVYENLKER